MTIDFPHGLAWIEPGLFGERAPEEDYEKKLHVSSFCRNVSRHAHYYIRVTNFMYFYRKRLCILIVIYVYLLLVYVIVVCVLSMYS